MYIHKYIHTYIHTYRLHMYILIIIKANHEGQDREDTAGGAGLGKKKKKKKVVYLFHLQQLRATHPGWAQAKPVRGIFFILKTSRHPFLLSE